MSFTNNDIHNAAGPGSSAEPSMEEILASIRRILKDDDPGMIAEAAPPADMDDDVLLLDQSMIARPADVSTATMPPAPPLEDPPSSRSQPGDALHFSSEPVPFSQDLEPVARALPEPVLDLPPAAEPIPAPLPPVAPPARPEPAPSYRPLDPPIAATIRPAPEPFFTAPPRMEPPPPAAAPPPPAPAPPEKLIFPELRPAPPPPPEPEPFRPFVANTWQPPFAPAAAEPPRPNTANPPPEPYRPAPPPPAATPMEPPMPETQNSFEPPESLISDKTTDAAASSIGALVRSMTTDKSVAISKSSPVTIEDIVREEIRPLLKAWLDSHLPSLVERVVRTEIERVINRTVV
jgi:cell pole-organizing protein PopZ